MWQPNAIKRSSWLHALCLQSMKSEIYIYKHFRPRGNFNKWRLRYNTSYNHSHTGNGLPSMQVQSQWQKVQQNQQGRRRNLTPIKNENQGPQNWTWTTTTTTTAAAAGASCIIVPFLTATSKAWTWTAVFWMYSEGLWILKWTKIMGPLLHLCGREIRTAPKLVHYYCIPPASLNTFRLFSIFLSGIAGKDNWLSGRATPFAKLESIHSSSGWRPLWLPL